IRDKLVTGVQTCALPICSVSVTLTNVSAAVTVGLGVGIPNANGAGCNVNTTVDATPSSTAQITANIDVGTYCVIVYDTGKLRARSEERRVGKECRWEGAV